MRIFLGPSAQLLLLTHAGFKPYMCTGSDPDDLLTRKKAGDAVNLGGAGSAGISALEAMQAEQTKRLELLGASSAPPPPPAAPAMRLSTFSVSDSAAGRAEADELLRRMLMKDKGELEEPNADLIARAQRGSKQWQDAGLHERAYQELLAVEKYVSYSSALGARFHLGLADAAQASGREAEAKRLRQRVMADAQSSSLRWQAEQALSKMSSTTSGKTSTSSSSSNPELNSLFRMPSQWD
jgi:hypothetical protein